MKTITRTPRQAEDKLVFLREVDIFQDLTENEVQATSDMTKMCTYKGGHIFYMPNDPGEVLFILKRGRVQLYRVSPDGRKLVFATVQPGTIFGQMALVGQRMHNTFAEAVDDCLICIMGREEVEELIMFRPQVALRLLGALGERLVNVEQRLEDAAFQRMPVRLARLLLQLNEEQGNLGSVKGYTHQYLADMLGTYRETATQTLNEFKQQGIIELGRKSITISDVDGLEQIAAL